jgi:hypothetical protein
MANDASLSVVGTPFGMDWQFCEGEITEDNIPDI